MKKFLINILCCCIPVAKYRRNLRDRLYKRHVCAINNASYSKWLDDMHNNKSHFVPITDRPYVRRETDIKIFAYYLAQFHAIPENDDAHGKGFTEWTNVATCVPQFVGHWAPKIPYDVGFYNLNDVNVMRRQAEIAKMYGIYGFCFYYYWFSGKKILEKPLYNFLNSDIDFHFHFCWANENWSKLWDGGDREIILEQKLQEGDAEKFFADILPFIQDSRYEKIDNRPILMIYNHTLFERDALKTFLDTLNKLAKENGFNGFWFMTSNRFDIDAPSEYGFEGIIEFPPHGLWDKCPLVPVSKISQTTNFVVKDMTQYISERKYLYDAPHPVFKACFPSWDNTARKAYSYGTCFQMTDAQYAQWLTDIIKWTRMHNKKNQQYIYINAWNEWAEGAILEPNTRYGYKALQIVKDCLEQS